MKFLGQLLVLFVVAAAAVYFLNRDGDALKARLVSYGEKIAEHIEQVAASDESDASDASPDEGYESAEPPASDYVTDRNDDNYSSGGNVITSQMVLSGRGSDASEAGEQMEYSGRSEGTEDENRVWIKEATERHAPDSWYMLMKYDALPDFAEAPSTDGMTISSRKTASTFHFLEGRSGRELLSGMETNVHEIAHAYFSQNVFAYAMEHDMTLDWEMVYGYLYFSPGRSFFLSFPKESLFPSKELVREIPRELRTFRFDDYIDGNTSTQGQGVIGLLDELNAYYQDSKYSYDMFEVYCEVEGSEAAGLYQWVRKTQSSMTAFYEFDFFIREYLLLMQRDYPSDYEALKECRRFREAYGAVREAYEGLVAGYEERIRSEMDRLNASGQAEITMEEGTLWITLPGSGYRQGTSVYSEARATLMPVLSSNRFSNIESDFL